STATNKKALWDSYVKFFRWATDRLNNRDGIVCFVSNNSLVDQIAFDGMRKHLLGDFTRLYHVHLEGNVRHDPSLAGTTYNVFGIQVGVGITIAVCRAKHKDCRLYFQRVDKFQRREHKLAWLAQHGAIGGMKWQTLRPDARYTWLVPDHADEYSGFIPITSKDSRDREVARTIFALSSVGVKTNRDEVVYDFDRARLIDRVRTFTEDYNAEVDRYLRSERSRNVDEFVRYDKIKWSESLKSHLRRGRFTELNETELRQSMY
ncbi:unnamed protein product, partial [marine sediment metagenome]